ncbi:hypothetical protein INR49_010139 [Caranx melampygus]|nr:hypothetical protein INR49_010139 [Caranx melampygus]
MGSRETLVLQERQRLGYLDPQEKKGHQDLQGQKEKRCLQLYCHSQGDTVLVEGLQGDKGNKGETGDRGPKGVQGEKGETGAGGPPGAQGDPVLVGGPKGNKGEMGNAGHPGAPGNPGKEGLVGPKGARGAAGAAGLKGAQGEKGEKSQPGVPGPCGPPGEEGKSGPSGPPGATGLKGPEGAQGQKGEMGPDGAKGDRGEPGMTEDEIRDFIHSVMSQHCVEAAAVSSQVQISQVQEESPGGSSSRPVPAPLEEGSCGRYTMRWYFNSEAQACRPFIYSGCGGNHNRFLHLEECRSCVWETLQEPLP